MCEVDTAPVRVNNDQANTPSKRFGATSTYVMERPGCYRAVFLCGNGFVLGFSGLRLGTLHGRGGLGPRFERQFELLNCCSGLTNDHCVLFESDVNHPVMDLVAEDHAFLLHVGQRIAERLAKARQAFRR